MSVTSSTLGVSLWEVMEARGSPLSEVDIWAILAATVTTIQDSMLTGDVKVSVITPESVILRRCGRVDLIATSAHSSMHPHGNYLPPEAFSTNQQDHNHEWILVFSLGRTLWSATEPIPSMMPVTHSNSNHGSISSSLRSTLAAMTHNLPAHRLTLVDIFQLLVERLEGRDRINYTATIRSLYEEVLGPPIPPPHPPDNFMRERSYSTLEPKSSTLKRYSSSWNAKRSTSVENLHNPHFSLLPEPNSLDSLYHSATSHISPGILSKTARDKGDIRTSSLHDVSFPSNFSTSEIKIDEEEFNCHKSLWKSKMNFRSVDTLTSSKENLQPYRDEGRRLSFLGGTMNPIQETSPHKALSIYETHDLKSSNFNTLGHDSRTLVTVSRSATVAGVLKGQSFDTLCAQGLQKRIPPKKPPRSRAVSVDNLHVADLQSHQNQNEEIPPKRRMVMRTPSRLYRFAENVPVVRGRSDPVPAIIGPEFVVRSKEPVIHLSLVNASQVQRGVVKRVTVVLVSGRRIELTCDPTVARVSHVLQAVLEEEKMPLPHLLGLAVLGSGEFHFVAPQTKLHKVAPPGWKERHPTKDGLIQDNFTLHLRIVYYLKFNNVREMDRTSRQLLFLQLRHDLLEGRLHVPLNVLLQLAPLALQAEFGDQREQDVGYFLLEHYVPESLLRGGQSSKISEELHKRHGELSGRHYTLAQSQFINLVQSHLHYGTHFYHVTQDKGKQNCWLGIGQEGILVLDGAPSPDTLSHAVLYSWAAIKRLSYATHRLTIAVRAPDRTQKVKFNLQENRSRHVFYLATVHQSFYRESSSSSNVGTCSSSQANIITKGRPGQTEGGTGGTSWTFDSQHRAPSSCSSVATTGRTSLSSAGTGDEPFCGIQPDEAVSVVPSVVVTVDDPAGSQRLINGPTSVRSTHVAPSKENKSSDALSRAKIFSDILWQGAVDESDEVFSIKNLENEHQFKLLKQRQKLQKEQNQKDEFSSPRYFHKKSKSNVEKGSLGVQDQGQRQPRLSRHFGSDESLLIPPKKGTAVRMGTRVSAAALQKHRMRSLEGLVQLPSLEELNTSPTAIVVEPSIRSVVVEESVSDSLVERFSKCSGAAGPERRLQTVTLTKKNGSLGVMIAEGVDHGIYIQAVSSGGPAHSQGHLKPGDRIVGINGRSVENLPYVTAVDLLRQVDNQVTLLVSQPVTCSPNETPRASTSSLVQTDKQSKENERWSWKAREDANDIQPQGDISTSNVKSKEQGLAQVQVLGGTRPFIREVRSGPVTVITVNTTDQSINKIDPSINRTDSSGTKTSSSVQSSTLTQSGTLKEI